MIVAVEGPSAGGKTTWCRAHARRFVGERVPAGAQPDGSDLEAQAAYWVAVNSAKWSVALDLENAVGVAICDGDPLKLHYSWCLAALGLGPWSRFDREYRASRAAMNSHELGFVDVVLFSSVSSDVLRARRVGDMTRRRRSFELHVRMREPLMAWYRTVDALDPGRVVWGLPHDDDDLPARSPRPQRYDADLLDSLVAALPAL